MSIHPTAVVDPSAELAPGVEVGPYAVIGPRVTIGSGSIVMTHALIERDVTIGSDCRIYPMAAIGCDPQDLKYKGERTQVIIGDRVILREFVTIHRGTPHGHGKTVVDDDAMLMNYVHVAHDCHVGKRVNIANNLAMGGHGVIEDDASLGGMVGMHQFVRIGRHSFVGGYSRVSKDVPPYMLGEGSVVFKLYGPNVIGLKRKGFSEEIIRALKEAFRIVFRNHRPLAEVLDETRAALPGLPEIETLLEFMANSPRGVYR
jgi:UDP-N-acetylglucosamine acyltransferase